MKKAPAIGALLAAVGLLQAHIDESFGPNRATEEVLYVDDPAVLKRALVGFENVAADLYWLRTIQYFGGKRLEQTDKNYELLEPLLRITVTLDPNFKIAYTYGATFLSEPLPFGAGKPEKAVALIDDGIREHPDHWRFYLDKGFIYYWHLRDFDRAAGIFLEGSKLPGAPFWMRAIAGQALAQGGDRETARGLWQALHDTAETSQQRENAVAHLMQLDALDEMDALRRVVDLYRARVGRAPGDWRELVAAGMLPGIPVDPTGAPYVLDGATGEVRTSPETGLGLLPFN
jgi:tetratricopeptide (TPR) repeat protein